MCGIAGVLSFDQALAPRHLQKTAEAMNASLRHRGPDDEGLWIDDNAAVAFGHRRLSIVDLSPAGHQPMMSADGQFVITFNGEIYNYEDIRQKLLARGISFKGHSDTEVMLEAFSAFGVEETIGQLNGMFAFALWNRRSRTLWLARDRLGIKPMYWAKFGDLFLFGSELRALRVHPGWTPRLNRRAVASFMRSNYVPAPHTIYEDVQKLEPGTMLTLSWKGEPRITRYWDARRVAQSGLAKPTTASADEVLEQLETLLCDAVRRQMMADVPLGAFLSGGIDSSTVVALMQKINPGGVRTFTIGFEIKGYDEAPFAANVARHLGTNHTELIVTAQDALDVIPRLPDMYDEPFADSSQIPTYLVSAMTRKHVTVSLSGDGGDELFAGYERYRIALRLWRFFAMMPKPFRSALAASLKSLSPDQWSRLTALIPDHVRPVHFGDKIHKLASILGTSDGCAAYRRLVTHWEPDEVVTEANEYRGVLWDPEVAREMPGLLEQMQFLDTVTYLPDDILTKVDRASMAVGLEARVPLLDHRVVEFAWQLPRSMMIRNGDAKWLLRRILSRYVPKELIERPKMGFGIPLGDWLRGPLRNWAEALLGEQRLREAGLLDARQVRKYWQEHLDGRRNWQYLIWDVLMLESWRERWAKGVGGP
jgi:asparagine synthase (glutamine-hydrolysing)